MDFNLNEEQEMLRKLARDFLSANCPPSLVRKIARGEAELDPQLWRNMAQMGWMGITVPEKYGGMGGSFLSLIVLLEETGYACLPSLFFSGLIGGLALNEMGNDGQKQDLLPKIAQGELMVVLAFTEPGVRYDAQGITTKAVLEGGNKYSIDGVKLFISDAQHADYLVCPASSGKGITVFLLETRNPAIRCALLNTYAGDRQYEVILNKVSSSKENILGRVEQGWDLLQSVMRKATIAKCAEMVGGAQKALDMTLDYARERKQFGRPIGTFQAIQHYCANMAIDVDAARFLTRETAWNLNVGQPCVKEAAVAKAFVSDAYTRVCKMAHQIHGAIGTTEDHDLPLYSKSAIASRIIFGDPSYHREVVAQEIGL